MQPLKKKSKILREEPYPVVVDPSVCATVLEFVWLLDYGVLARSSAVCKAWRVAAHANWKPLWRHHTLKAFTQYAFFHKELLEFDVEGLYGTTSSEPAANAPPPSAWFEFFKQRIHPLLMEYRLFRRIIEEELELPWDPEYEQALRLSLFLIPASHRRRYANTKTLPVESFEMLTNNKKPKIITQIGGNPVLPPDRRVSGDGMFLAQLRLEDFKGAMATHGILPSRGVLYFYNNVFHYNGDKLAEATPQECDPDTSLPYEPIALLMECLQLDVELAGLDSDILDMHHSRTAFRLVSPYYCIGGPTVDMQSNHSVGKDEMLLLQYTDNGSVWFGIFYIGTKDDIKQGRWSTIVPGDSMMR